ncbi:isocitrate/isopropylmalate family dehydrogenase, partial [Streptomyces sp. NPDC057757]|uniref:isocitrate/isopropylmalate family dehydrogenase n=1 Tax=Streptomyces sp. NPDC057757 TaxID=3346241 RepID=UPI0036C0E36A
SAPDIAGRGIANPVGQIWSGAMMLEHLGETAAAAGVIAAIESVLERQPEVLTPDLGGTATTEALGTAIARRITGTSRKEEGSTCHAS